MSTRTLEKAESELTEARDVIVALQLRAHKLEEQVFRLGGRPEQMPEVEEKVTQTKYLNIPDEPDSEPMFVVELAEVQEDDETAAYTLIEGIGAEGFPQRIYVRKSRKIRGLKYHEGGWE